MSPIDAQIALLRATMQRALLRITDLENRVDSVEDQAQRHVMIMDTFSMALSEMRLAEIDLLARAANGGRDDDGAR